MADKKKCISAKTAADIRIQNSVKKQIRIVR